MSFLVRLLPVLAALVLSSAAWGQSSDDAAAGDAPAKYARPSERLDVYGVGMCHQCEWRPHSKVMAAGDQCGTGPDGKVKVAVFECGRSPSCDPVCNFLRCGTEQ